MCEDDGRLRPRATEPSRHRTWRTMEVANAVFDADDWPQPIGIRFAVSRGRIAVTDVSPDKAGCGAADGDGELRVGLEVVVVARRDARQHGGHEVAAEAQAEEEHGAAADHRRPTSLRGQRRGGSAFTRGLTSRADRCG